MHRRALLVNGTLLLAGIAKSGPLHASHFSESGLRSKSLSLGLVTDLHYADKPPAGSRYYRETLEKFRDARSTFEKHSIDCLIELGDLIDSAPTVQEEIGYLQTIDQQLKTTCKDRHYVLGNHCVSTLYKKEFLEQIDRSESFYSFDREGFHFVILDACFRSDGEAYGRNNFKWTDSFIPRSQLDWLASDLRSTSHTTVVFVHQRLDVSNDHGIKNGAEVRKILEASKRVAVVFQGHSHQNDYREIEGIHYVTLVAMVEGSGIEQNGYSLLHFHDDGSMALEGFRKQKPWDRK